MEVRQTFQLPVFIFLKCEKTKKRNRCMVVIYYMLHRTIILSYKSANMVLCLIFVIHVIEEEKL